MKKGILLLAFLLAICCGSGLYAQNVSCKSYFEVVETNDENHRPVCLRLYASNGQSVWRGGIGRACAVLMALRRTPKIFRKIL